MSSVIEPETVTVRAGPPPARGRGQWLRGALIDLATSGDVPPGSRLPGARTLANRLGLSRGLVAATLSQLAAEGFLASNPRSGFVLLPPAMGALMVPSNANDAPGGPPSPGTPDLALFPRSAWGRAFRRVLSQTPDPDLGYPDPQGHPRLRQVLADYLLRVRGLQVGPDEVMVVAGVAQALSLLARWTLAASGGSWAVERPGSPGTRRLLQNHGVRVKDVPVDDRGLVPEHLPRDAAAILVTPAHQYPTGVQLSAQRRRELVDRAASLGALVVEDDYDADLLLDGQPLAALQRLAADRVVLVGSVSKALIPALRLGWLVAPRSMLPSLVAAKESTDLGCAVLEQLTLAGMIASGAYDRHLRHVRPIYRRRRQALVAALAEHQLPLQPLGHPAGLHLCLRAANARVAAATVEVLTAASVPAEVGENPELVVIGYAALDEHRARTVAAELGGTNLLRQPA
jgi:GntR family transcriptional regulator/MocR family aminotransferase